MNRLIAATAVVIALGAVIAGLVAVGGPGEARLLREDQRRLQDLFAIARALKCDEGTVMLPTELTEPTLARHCGIVALEADRLSDPFTGLPYRYDRRSDSDFAVCAEFSRPEDLRHAGVAAFDQDMERFDPDSGCVVGRAG